MNALPWLGTLRQWHWISSALCLAGMLLFAVTGITLNHATQIEAKPRVINHQAQLPEALQALSWCTWAYVTYGALVGRLHVATQGEEVWRNAAQAEALLRQLSELLAVLDARLAVQPWMLGADYSLVDLVVGSVLGYSVYLGAPVKAHPHVQAWLARVQARPAMQIEA